MTPQQMHIEAAKKVIHAFMDDPSAISIRGILTPMIARAIAEAENRAAWDGYDFGVSAREMYSECESKYGPRPTTENQP